MPAIKALSIMETNYKVGESHSIPIKPTNPYTINFYKSISPSQEKKRKTTDKPISAYNKAKYNSFTEDYDLKNTYIGGNWNIPISFENKYKVK